MESIELFNRKFNIDLKVKAAVFLIALVAMLALNTVFPFQTNYSSDCDELIAGATSIIAGKGYFDEAGLPLRFPMGTSYVMAGAMLAGIPFTVLFLVLEFLGLVAVYLLAKRFCSEKIALMLVLILSFSAVFATYGKAFLSEGPSFLLITLLALLYHANKDKINSKHSILFGVVAGLAALFRYPNGIMFLVIEVLLFRKGKVKEAIVCLIVFLLVMSPQLLYNIENYGNIIGGYSNPAEVLEARYEFDEQGKMNLVVTPTGETTPLVNPVHAISNGYNRPNILLVPFYLLFFELSLVFFTIYAMAELWKKQKEIYYFVLPFAFFWLFHFYAGPRFLFPVYGLMAVIAGKGLNEIYKKMNLTDLTLIAFLAVSIFLDFFLLYRGFYGY